MSDVLVASLERCTICKGVGQVGTDLEVSKKAHGHWLHYHLLCLDGRDPWRGEAAA